MKTFICMKTHLLLFLLLFLGTSCGNSTKPSGDASADDAVIVLKNRLPIADPYVLCHGGRYYAYGTNVRGFEVYISTDLEHWTRNSRLALSPEDSWGDKGYWAPEVYYVEPLKKFYMYYTVNEQVCVATSDSPEGPFVQDVKQPLFGSEKNIDPSLFIDSDGKAYLYFVRFTGGNVIWCAELNADLKSLKAETLTKCIEARDEWERRQATVAEGPSILKQDGVYYLLYSANHFESKDYAVGYATSDSPLGPWKKYSGNPILRRDMDLEARLAGTGHGAPFVSADGSYKYIFHAHASLDKVQPRSSYIKDLTLSKEGVISIHGKVVRPVVVSNSIN